MMNKFMKYSQREQLPDDVKISYSQYAMYATCPKRWELSYIKGLREYTPSIHTVFGTAMHEVMQHYLTTMYTKSASAADRLNLSEMLLTEMRKTYQAEVEKTNTHFSNKFDMIEFYEDGVTILDYFKKRRGSFFSKKHEELVGIELPIYYPATDVNEHVMMLGYLDVVIRDKRDDTITIIDIKTSTNGWNKYQKADKVKTAQLVLYKKYFAEQYNHPVDKIDIKYLILKRKLIEGAMFPQKRITTFAPANGSVTRNRLAKDIETFVKSSFNEDGSYNTERPYLAIAGRNKKNCKFCEYSDNEELCPLKQRISG